MIGETMLIWIITAVVFVVSYIILITYLKYIKELVEFGKKKFDCKLNDLRDATKLQITPNGTLKEIVNLTKVQFWTRLNNARNSYEI